jgi:hypothetical protein
LESRRVVPSCSRDLRRGLETSSQKPAESELQAILSSQCSHPIPGNAGSLG